MLHIITPNEQHTYSDMISEMFAHLNSESSKYAYQKDDFDTPEAIYCAYIDDRFGLIGSARLLPRPALLADHVKLDDGEDGYWECNRVFFDIHEDAPIHEDPDAFREITQQFYQNLYKGIKDFTESYGINALVFVNPVDEHEDMVFFGQWPFEVESLIDIESNGALSTFAVGGCSFSGKYE
jgi:N-acyl-L-homoserine lactone synthetase